MSLLTLDFPPRSQWPGWNYPILTLVPFCGTQADVPSSDAGVGVARDYRSSLPAELAVTCTLGGSDYASDSPIFLAAEGDSSGEYALKVALREDLVASLTAEYLAYSTHLRSLQGKLVPRCYGLFVSNRLALGEEIPAQAALVLSYAGAPPPIAFPQLPDMVKREILRALQELHGTGIVHKDLAERNILLEPLRSDGNVTGPDDFRVHIIDFDAIEVGHKCPGLAPLEGQPCEQLTEVASMMGLPR